MAERTGAANVTATKYRKHLATMMQLVQLSGNEMDIVATFGNISPALDVTYVISQINITFVIYL